MITRPTIEQMETLLSLDRQRFYSALTLLGIADEVEDADVPLSTYHVIRLRLLDWMNQIGVLDPLSQVATIKAFDHAIEPFARQYDELEILDDKRLKRPAAGFTILDNYAAVMPQPYHCDGYYIVSTAEWTYTLPEPALTAVTCDLSVLVLQTLDKMRETFQTAG